MNSLLASALPSLVLLICNPTASLGDPNTPKLTLTEAVNKTLQKNKELEAYSWELRSSDGKKLQANLLPNPQLSINPENVVGSKFFRQQIQNTIEISQLIELGNKRAKRLAAAESEQQRMLSDYEIKRNDVLAELNLHFIHVLRDQAMLELMHRSRSLIEKMLKNIQARVDAGSGAGYEEPRTRVLLAHAKIDEEHSEHELLTSRKLLASFWNEEELDQNLEGNLTYAGELPPLESLYERIRVSPKVTQAKAEERLKTALLSLEESRRVPDVTIGLGWRYGRSLDEQAGTASLSIPLQIFDRNQGNIAQASAIKSRAATENDALPVRMKAAVFEIYQELKHVHTELGIIKSEILPQSEKAMTLLQEGYKIGRYSFLEFKDSQAVLIENYAAQIKTAVTLHELSIELNRLLGGPNYEPLQ